MTFTNSGIAQEIEGAVVEQMEGELYNNDSGDTDSGFEYSDDDSDLEEERIDALLKTYELEQV